MSSASVATASAASGVRLSVNPWLVAAVVVVPTFMEVLDTTIANVALRYIAGGLSAAVIDSEWVITSYLASNAIILPISGWLAAHLGRRNYFLLSIAVFTLASGACGMATSLEELILFRVIQGLAGGGLQPCTQGVLLDTFSAREAGLGHDPVCHCRPDRADPGADVGRLDYRQLQLALDLLYEFADRRDWRSSPRISCFTILNILRRSVRRCVSARSTSTRSDWDCWRS